MKRKQYFGEYFETPRKVNYKINTNAGSIKKDIKIGALVLVGAILATFLSMVLCMIFIGG